MKYYETLSDALWNIDIITENLAEKEGWIFWKSRASCSMYLKDKDGDKEIRISNHKNACDSSIDLDLRDYYTVEKEIEENLDEQEIEEWERTATWDDRGGYFTRFRIDKEDETRYRKDLIDLLKKFKGWFY